MSWLRKSKELSLYKKLKFPKPISLQPDGLHI